jgi:O-antigen ligase
VIKEESIKGDSELNLFDKVVLYTSYGLFLGPLLPQFAVNVTTGLFSFFAVLSFFINKQKSFNWTFFGINILLYLCYLVSLFYSDDLEYGIKRVITALPLLLIPLSLSLLSNGLVAHLKAKLIVYIKIYVVAVGVLALATLLYNYDFIRFPELLHGEILIKGAFNGMEALYFSFHLAIAAIGAIYLFWRSSKLIVEIFGVFAIAFFFIFLLVMSFKSTIMAFIIAFGLLSLMVNRMKLWTVFIASLFLTAGLLSISPRFNEQFTRLLIVKNAADIEYVEIKETIRSCAIELVPVSGIFGFGIGDGKDKLIQCYEGKSSKLQNISYNSHNQYLSVSLNVGFLGLIALACTLFTMLFIGLNRKNYLGIAILILISVFMLAENILEREQGVIYFAIFINFLFFENFPKSLKSPMILSHERVMKSLNNNATP